MLLKAEKTNPKTYSSPKLSQLTTKQVKPFLVQHASRGDQGAKDLLELLSQQSKDSGR